MTELPPPASPAGPPQPPGPPPATTGAAPVVAGWHVPSPGAGHGDGLGVGVAIVSLLPMGFVLLLAVLAPAFYAPLVDGSAAILGLPPVVAFFGVLALLIAINLVVVRLTHNPFVLALVVSATTVTGLFVAILAPAIILIVVNLRDLPVD